MNNSNRNISDKDEQLTERITVRFTKSELRMIEALADREGERKTSSFLRRNIVLLLRNAEKTK